MNKSQIKKYLESERFKALDVVDKKHSAILKEAEALAVRDAIKDVDIAGIERALKEALPGLKKIEDFFKANTKWNYGGTHARSATFYIQDVLNMGLVKGMVGELEPSYANRSYGQARNEEKDLVRKEFYKIEGNISQMTAKQAVEYLKGLGFDIDKETPTTTSTGVLAPVDIKFLNDLRGGK